MPAGGNPHAPKKRVVTSLLGHSCLAALCSLVFFTGGSLGPTTLSSTPPQHPHTRAQGMWVTDPNSTPRGRAVGGGGAPDHRRPSQRRKAPPPGTPFPHPHSEQRRPARAHAVGPELGPRAHTDRIRNTRVAEPRPPAPEDGRPGEGQRLTPDAPRNSGRPPPPGTAPQAHRACRPRGKCRAPTPTHPRPQLVGGGPQQPAQWAGSRGRDSA